MKLSEFKSKQNTDTQKEEQQTNKVEQLFNNYKDMNSNELMQELMKNVANGKRDGSFDFDKLKQSVEQVMPYLSQSQQQIVLNLLEQIK